MTRLASQRARFPTLRSIVAKIGALLLGALLLVASLRAGQTYWWCVPMQEASFEPCCGHGDEDDEAAVRPDRGPTFERSCCVSRTIGALPAASASGGIEGLSVAPAVLLTVSLGVVSAASDAPPPPVHAVSPPRRHGPTRDGPRPLSARERCIDLQVFRC